MAAGNGQVQFEGIAEGSEVLGATQANFVVYRSGQHAKETSVLLNDPAATYLAGLLGMDDGVPFRASAARHVGQLWLEAAVEAGHHIESIVFLSKGSLESHPALVERLKQIVAEATALKAAEEDHGELVHA